MPHNDFRTHWICIFLYALYQFIYLKMIGEQQNYSCLKHCVLLCELHFRRGACSSVLWLQILLSVKFYVSSYCLLEIAYRTGGYAIYFVESNRLSVVKTGAFTTALSLYRKEYIFKTFRELLCNLWYELFILRFRMNRFSKGVWCAIK